MSAQPAAVASAIPPSVLTEHAAALTGAEQDKPSADCARDASRGEAAEHCVAQFGKHRDAAQHWHKGIHSRIMRAPASCDKRHGVQR